MTDADAEALAHRVSDDPVRLDPDDLACRDCGRVVAGPFDLTAVSYAEPTGVALGSGAVSSSVAGLDAEPLTSCSDCAARRATAVDLAARLLPRGVTIGGLSYTGDHVVGLVRSSLVAVDVLGMRPPDPAAVTGDLLGVMVRRLAALGAPLAWSGRFSPVRQTDARSGTANPRPWAHVRESSRAALRDAYAALMADRLSLTAPPVSLVPPPLDPRDVPASAQPLTSGCLLCGVGVVPVPALAVARAGGREAAAREVWTLRPTVAPDALGGRRSPIRLLGYTCPGCTAALDYAGAVGPSALERSLLVALDMVGRWADGSDALDNLAGWGGLWADHARRGLPPLAPNPHPWAHVGDLGALRDRLAAALGTGTRG